MSIPSLLTGLTSTTQLVLLKDNIIIQTNNQVMLLYVVGPNKFMCNNFNGLEVDMTLLVG
jgi:hypothetical protein